MDSAQFQQMVVNLCTNAWQALDDQEGQVRVLLDSVALSQAEAASLGLAAGEHVKLQVSDDGPGMEEHSGSDM